MSSFSSGYGYFIPKNAGFVEISRIFLFHPNGAAAATNIAGKTKKFFDRHQFKLFVANGFGSFLQVQFVADRDAEYANAGALAPGY